VRLRKVRKEDDFSGLMESGVYREDARKAEPGKEDRGRRAYEGFSSEPDERNGRRAEGSKYPVTARAVFGGRKEEPKICASGAKGDRMVTACAEFPETEALLFLFLLLALC